MASGITFLITIGLFLSAAYVRQGQGWRGLAPLHSTRADVERLLGPSADRKFGVTYDLGEVAVSFEYSSGPCTKERVGGWDVPEDTVIRIRVSPAVKPRLADLKLDNTKFKVVEDAELPDVLYYTNSEEGIIHEVHSEVVMTTEYGPTLKESHLRCDAPPGVTLAPQ